LASSESWIMYGPGKDLGMYSLIACNAVPQEYKKYILGPTW
jgi:hypothetical protein